jgi:hypothetical protein
MSMLGSVVGAALWFAAHAEGGGEAIHWKIAPGVSCPTRTQLQSAYTRESASHPAFLGTEMVVSVSVDRPSRDTLRLQLSTAPSVFQAHRDIVAGDGRCDELAQTVAILLDAWLSDLPELTRESEATADPPPPAPARAKPVPAAADGSLVAVRAKATPQPTEHGLGFALYAGADAFAGSTTAAAVTFGADLRLSRRVAVEATASLIQNLTIQDSGNGSIGVRRQLFGALAAVTLYQPRPSLPSLDAVGGVVLWHGNAWSSGYPASHSRELYDPGLMLGARARQKLWGELFLQGQVAAVGLLRSYGLEVGRPSGETVTLAVLPRLALDLSLGVGVQFF